MDQMEKLARNSQRKKNALLLCVYNNGKLGFENNQTNAKKMEHIQTIFSIYRSINEKKINFLKNQKKKFNKF